jgi:putative ABC transport system substrate-binding protein
MRRREFIAGLGSAATWPVVARAQQGGQMRRSGVLSGLVEDRPDNQLRYGAFRQSLERLGWLEGRNVRIEYRFAASSPTRFQAFAKELIAQQPDVIFADTTPAAVALQRESRTVPIVFIGGGNP